MRYFLTALSFSPLLRLKCLTVSEDDGFLAAKSQPQLC